MKAMLPQIDEWVVYLAQNIVDNINVKRCITILVPDINEYLSVKNKLLLQIMRLLGNDYAIEDVLGGAIRIRSQTSCTIVNIDIVCNFTLSDAISQDDIVVISSKLNQVQRKLAMQYTETKKHVETWYC